MRSTVAQFVTFFGVAAMLLTAADATAVAQESRGRREPAQSDGQPTLRDPAPFDQYQQPGKLGRRANSQRAAEETLGGEPKETIALTLWMLSVTADAPPAADELTLKLAGQVADLDTVIGSIGDVRELVGRLKVAGMLRRAREFRLTSLNGQSVSMQNGRNQPRIVATNVDPRAGRMNSITYEQVGTMIELQPQIDSKQNIQVRIKFTDSDLEKRDVPIVEPAAGNADFADIVTTRQLGTTASLKNGAATLLQSVATTGLKDDQPGGETELIILGAAVVPARE